MNTGNLWAAWFCGVFTVVEAACFWGLLKGVWFHDKDAICKAIVGLVFFGLIALGSFFSAVK